MHPLQWIHVPARQALLSQQLTCWWFTASHAEAALSTLSPASLLLLLLLLLLQIPGFTELSIVSLLGAMMSVAHCCCSSPTT
jgi:hypothetical protein